MKWSIHTHNCNNIQLNVKPVYFLPSDSYCMFVCLPRYRAKYFYNYWQILVTPWPPEDTTFLCMLIGPVFPSVFFILQEIWRPTETTCCNQESALCGHMWQSSQTHQTQWYKDGEICFWCLSILKVLLIILYLQLLTSVVLLYTKLHKSKHSVVTANYNIDYLSLEGTLSHLRLWGKMNFPPWKMQTEQPQTARPQPETLCWLNTAAGPWLQEPRC